MTWTMVDRKSVYDSDGFTTDYTWYKSLEDGYHVFIFGDADLYTPEDGVYDWETDSEEVAQEWWDSYDEDTVFNVSSTERDESYLNWIMR